MGKLQQIKQINQARKEAQAAKKCPYCQQRLKEILEHQQRGHK